MFGGYTGAIIKIVNSSHSYSCNFERRKTKAMMEFPAIINLKLFAPRYLNNKNALLDNNFTHRIINNT